MAKLDHVNYISDFIVYYLDEDNRKNWKIYKNVSLDSIRFIVPTKGIWDSANGIWIPPHRILNIKEK